MPHKSNYAKPTDHKKPPKPKGGNIGKAMRDRDELYNKTKKKAK
jgi:hypothetical protein